MSRVTLIACYPRRSDGTVETLLLVDRSPRAAAYLGAQWLPLVTELPGFEMAIGFDGQRFGALPSPQIGALAFALAPEIRAAAGWVWRDAEVIIRQADWPLDGSNPADAAFTTVWVGNAASISIEAGIARVELIDRGQLLREPVATLRFGSSGIALLDAAAAARDRQVGQVVPVAFGRVLGMPGLLVDRANNIWLFAAGGFGSPPASSVEAFYDGGVPFTLGSARASLAALQGTSPAPGTVDWCLNVSGLLLARPADRPVYPFTCDATFGSTALGDVAFNILGSRLSFTPLPEPLNTLGLGACGLYIDDEATVAEALDRLLAGLGIYWKVRADGLVDAKRLQWDAPVASFAAYQRHAPRRLQTILPTARRRLGYARNNRVHGEGEIARILLATELAYADGTLIEALKPAQAGANLTATNGANRVPFSRMERNQGWAGITNSPGGLTGTVYFTFEGRRAVVAQATATAAGQALVIMPAPADDPQLKVEPGERLSISFRVGALNASSWQMNFRYRRADNSINEVFLASGSTYNWTVERQTLFYDVPADARLGTLKLYVFSAGAGAYECLISEPMMVSATAGQTLHPGFSPGANAENGATVGAPAGTDVAGVAAATLVADAATAKADSASALSSIATITSDAVLSRDEKPAVRQQRDSIIGEYAGIIARADSFGVNRVTFATAYADLISYLGTVALDSATDTAIVRATFNGRFVDYYIARQGVLDGIALVASQRANLQPGNVVVNSEFARGTYGYRFSGNTLAGPAHLVTGGVNLSPSWSGIKNVMWATVNTGGANWGAGGLADPFTTRGLWIDGNMADQRAFGLPVKQGDRVFARCLLARHRCTTQLYLLVFDKDGTLLEAPNWTGGRVDGAGGGNPANFDVVGGIHTVSHANAASAQLMWRMLTTNQPDPYIFMTEPAMGQLPSWQTELPPYQLGNNDPLADPTRTVLPDVPKGEWASGVSYLAGESVFYRASTYTARIDHTSSTGNRPPDAATWRLSAQAGDSSALVSIPLTTVNGSATIVLGSFNVRVGSAGEVVLGTDITVTNAATSASNNGAELTWQRETSPGTWANVGATFISASLSPGASVSGQNVARTATGLAAGSVQAFRLVCDRDGPAYDPLDPSAEIVRVSGSMSGQGQ